MFHFCVLDGAQGSGYEPNLTWWLAIVGVSKTWAQQKQGLTLGWSQKNCLEIKIRVIVGTSQDKNSDTSGKDGYIRDPKGNVPQSWKGWMDLKVGHEVQIGSHSWKQDPLCTLSRQRSQGKSRCWGSSPMRFSSDPLVRIVSTLATERLSTARSVLYPVRRTICFGDHSSTQNW